MEAGGYENMLILAVFTIISCALIHLVYRKVFKSKKNETVIQEAEKESVDEASVQTAPDTAIPETRPSAKSKKRAPWKSKTEFTHPWLLKSLKGHPGSVLHLDFSANGKFMAAACEDGSVILWDIRDLNQKDHRTLRLNLEFEHATHVAWSPDSKAFIIHTARENNIMVYKIEKKKEGGIASASHVNTFEKAHEDNIVGIGISNLGKCIMSCSSKTDMIIWDLKGQRLDKVDTYLMNTYCAKVSPCGRFVVATGFVPDVKVMEVSLTKNGEYKQLSKAFELKGHSSGIYDVAFDVDSSHMATISKDGTWKLHLTKIQYAIGQSPHVLETGKYTQTANAPKIALSPNAEVLAVSVDSSVEFYDTHFGERYETVENIFAGLITFMQFDASGKYLFVSGDKSVRVFYNVCGFQTRINTCHRLLGRYEVQQTSATVDRLKEEIATLEETIRSFNGH